MYTDNIKYVSVILQMLKSVHPYQRCQQRFNNVLQSELLKYSNNTDI